MDILGVDAPRGSHERTVVLVISFGGGDEGEGDEPDISRRYDRSADDESEAHLVLVKHDTHEALYGSLEYLSQFPEAARVSLGLVRHFLRTSHNFRPDEVEGLLSYMVGGGEIVVEGNFCYLTAAGRAQAKALRVEEEDEPSSEFPDDWRGVLDRLVPGWEYAFVGAFGSCSGDRASGQFRHMLVEALEQEHLFSLAERAIFLEILEEHIGAIEYRSHTGAYYLTEHGEGLLEELADS